MICILITKTDT